MTLDGSRCALPPVEVELARFFAKVVIDPRLGRRGVSVATAPGVASRAYRWSNRSASSACSGDGVAVAGFAFLAVAGLPSPVPAGAASVSATMAAVSTAASATTVPTAAGGEANGASTAAGFTGW